MAYIADRLTIQIDLSGFSFKITDPQGGKLSSGEKSFPSGLTYGAEFETTLKKEFSSFSTLSKKYNEIVVLVATPKYTLVPTSLFRKEDEKQILTQIHTLDEMDEVMSVEIPEHQATLVYAIPNSITSRVFKIQKKAKYYPTVYPMIQKLSELNDNNKVCVNFAKDYTHIVAAEGHRLLLANSYPTPDFTTAQYYLFLVIKEVMFNPEFTTLQVLESIDKVQSKNLNKYFKGVNTLKL